MNLLHSCLRLDAALRTVIAGHHSPVLDPVMIAVSAIGRRGGIWLALGLLVAFVRPSRAKGVWQLALAIGLAGLTADYVMKPAFGRMRPFEAGDVRLIADRPATASFPSGHAATAFAGAYVLTRVWRSVRVGLWAVALLIAFSRIYVGVHYPLDVIAGALVGLSCGAFVVGGTVWSECPARGTSR